MVTPLGGCSPETVRPGRDAGRFSDGGGVVSGCDPSVDSDSDGIADAVEGNDDADGDGVPNNLDPDSDGDGIPDAMEAGPNPCVIFDSDGDGTPNFRDLDSDNDGLSDQEEVSRYGTDPLQIDTDRDGVTDLGEARGTMTNPLDPESRLPDGDFFVVLPYDGVREERTLRFGTDISVADIYFLIDTTGSMGSPISNVQSSLTTLSSQIDARIPSAYLGVGEFRDFPVGSYGNSGDVPYRHGQDVTDNLSLVQDALNRLSAGGGNDGPESHVEAMFQTATGLGGNWIYGGSNVAVPLKTCPAIPDEPAPRRGYPCFRAGALPIVVMVTDVSMHNGPMLEDTYTGFTPAPATFAQGVGALASIGARFIGVAVNGGGRAHLEAAARMTGTVDASGNPLVYDAAGGTVSDSVIDGIGAITGGVAQNVGTRTENVAGNPGEFDATRFIKAIVPREGYREGVPGAGYDSKDERTFYTVIPGTQVEFDVDFYNDVRPPSDTAEIFRARIVVVGNSVADLDSREVYIIVPPTGGTILI